MSKIKLVDYEIEADGYEVDLSDCEIEIDGFELEVDGLEIDLSDYEIELVDYEVEIEDGENELAEIKECFEAHFVVRGGVAICVGWPEFLRLPPDVVQAVLEYRNERYEY